MKDIDLDFQREQRLGIPEIVFGAGKSVDQLRDISLRHEQHGKPLLITRCSQEQVTGIAGTYDAVSGTLVRMAGVGLPKTTGRVAVIYAGSSDALVAREAIITARFLGCETQEFGDCGVAGLHRLLAHQEAISRSDVLICCAGFEGALASVLGGLFPQPLIAVPTSVGYGVAQGGVAALHSMLASCASGVMVMNIDNGCGAAMAAARILNQFNRRNQS